MNAGVVVLDATQSNKTLRDKRIADIMVDSNQGRVLDSSIANFTKFEKVHQQNK
jgi:hypothetical protein